jgi:hypothetical protein
MFALSMTKMGFDKLKHDIKGSTSRLKILLRNLENGDIDLNATIRCLKSRATDLATHYPSSHPRSP